MDAQIPASGVDSSLWHGIDRPRNDTSMATRIRLGIFKNNLPDPFLNIFTCAYKSNTTPGEDGGYFWVRMS